MSETFKERRMYRASSIITIVHLILSKMLDGGGAYKHGHPLYYKEIYVVRFRFRRWPDTKRQDEEF